MNLPDDFRNRIQRQLPDSAQQFFTALEAAPATGIRVNSRKISQPLAQDRIAWTQHGYRLSERPNLTLDPLLHAGCYYVQEPSSMVLEPIVRQLEVDRPGLRILDVCAAPGGKATHLLSLIADDSLLVANEVIQPRASVLAENLTKWGGANFVVTRNDPADLGQLGETFDALLVDAPCSGEGMFRKEPETRAQWSAEILSLCVERQKRILRDVLPALKLGGVLIYSTCTFHPDENEGLVAWLSREMGLEVLPLKLDETWGFEGIPIESGNGLIAWPHRVSGEGFFVAALHKSRTQQPTQPIEDANQRRPARSHVQKRKRLQKPRVQRSTGKPPVQSISPDVQSTIAGWLLDSTVETTLLQVGSKVRAFVAEHAAWIGQLAGHLRIVAAGIDVADVKRTHCIPSHGLAVSGRLNVASFPLQRVDRQTALRFLHRDSIESTGDVGQSAVVYEGTPLGWINVLPARSNNRYPQSWRIRMPLPEESSWSLWDELQ